MCIDDNWSVRDGSEPKTLEVVTVVSTETHDTLVYYNLLEYPKDKSGCTQAFNASKFIPLSEIDELQIQKPEACTH